MKTLSRTVQARLTPPKQTDKAWLGLNIYLRRRKLGLTQEQLASEAGISVRSLRDLETVVPDNNPELDTILALAKALQMTVSQLFRPRPDIELPEV